ncbi:MAG: GNAT family N-acetyltransferase [Alphaproteobacteria bacterium]|nr:GNAT family N-acetyltransferase [Alphaproteobacteria bacterium]MCL2758199.1 GNAT family N-acetyltransferase [Alphaproteobacteria bacterium]
MKEFPEIIKDGDIELRRPAATFDNARMTFDAVDSNREYLGGFLAWPKHVVSPESQFEWLMKINETKDHWLVYVDGKFAGAVSFVHMHRTPEKRWAEIGAWTGPEFAGKGVATRAVKMLEDMAFETGEIERVQLVIDDLNIGSWRIAEKLGYTLEGILRNYIYGGTKASGDMRMYSKLKSEWKK